MRTYTLDEVRAMSYSEVEVLLSNAVYAATHLLEQLEIAGKLVGNGHHARQAVANAACRELHGRWIDEK